MKPKNYSCLNYTRKPVVVGITSLGLDHTSLLGNTVELIAWQKAGILKPGVPAFTVQNQPGDSLNVIKRRAKEIGVKYLIIKIEILFYTTNKPFYFSALSLLSQICRTMCGQNPKFQHSDLTLMCRV